MANVIAIIQDDRVRRQVEQFLQQLDLENLRFATFKNHQEFTALYFRERKVEVEPATPPTGEAPPAAAEHGTEETEMKLFSEVHLMIFALDSIGEKSTPWLEKVKANFKRYKYWPQNAPLRTVMLKYEDDNVSKLDVIHPMLDDLIYLPLDRLVFLQKLEILLHLPKVIKPKFLFNQEVKQEIEISKISKLDRLSDVGLAIRNPIPLKKGLPGHFYIQLPGEKNRMEIRAKVFRSEPHPDLPGQYLVFFTYFGLAKNDLSTIRRTLAKSPRYQSLYNDDRSVFRFKVGNLFANAGESKTFGVAVIDPDAALAGNLAQQIGKDMDRVKVLTESSYSLFLHKYFDPSGISEKTPPKATEAADFYQPKLTLTLAATDLKCLSVDPGPSPEDLLLGHKALDIFATPEKWLSLIVDKGSRLVLEEAVQLAAKGRPSEKVLVMQDSTDLRRAVNCKFERSTAEHLVTLELQPASLSDIVVKLGTDQHNKDLEVLILDAAFVPEDPMAWIQGLRQRAVQVGLIKEPGSLKFFLTTESETRMSENWLNVPDILGLFIKPVDTRQLLFLMSEYLPNKDSVYQFENLGWAQPALSVHVSKSVQLEALSEFGATLKSKQALVPGTMIYLRKSIYDNAPNECLAARVYACEQHQTEKEFFQVYATYFGINDQFLKFARTWIRENYATQKGKEN